MLIDVYVYSMIKYLAGEYEEDGEGYGGEV
jgi:hypothetical protein